MPADNYAAQGTGVGWTPVHERLCLMNVAVMRIVHGADADANDDAHGGNDAGPVM